MGEKLAWGEAGSCSCLDLAGGRMRRSRERKRLCLRRPGVKPKPLAFLTLTGRLPQEEEGAALQRASFQAM